MPWDAPGSTAIVILTPETDAVTGDVYRRHAGAGRDGMTPHITVLVPFVPVPALDDEVDAKLRRVLRRFQPFDYELARLERFPGGTLYLVPEPSALFVELTVAVTEAFPNYPPYDGAHDTVVPHATVAQSGDSAVLDRIAAQVAPALPIACHAERVTIVNRDDDRRWRPFATLYLGR